LTTVQETFVLAGHLAQVNSRTTYKARQLTSAAQVNSHGIS